MPVRSKQACLPATRRGRAGSPLGHMSKRAEGGRHTQPSGLRACASLCARASSTFARRSTRCLYSAGLSVAGPGVSNGWWVVVEWGGVSWGGVGWGDFGVNRRTWRRHGAPWPALASRSNLAARQAGCILAGYRRNACLHQRVCAPIQRSTGGHPCRPAGHAPGNAHPRARACPCRTPGAPPLAAHPQYLSAPPLQWQGGKIGGWGEGGWLGWGGGVAGGAKVRCGCTPSRSSKGRTHRCLRLTTAVVPS